METMVGTLVVSRRHSYLTLLVLVLLPIILSAKGVLDPSSCSTLSRLIYSIFQVLARPSEINGFCEHSPETVIVYSHMYGT